jgi:hypothetical protein
MAITCRDRHPTPDTDRNVLPRDSCNVSPETASQIPRSGMACVHKAGQSVPRRTMTVAYPRHLSDLLALKNDGPELQTGSTLSFPRLSASAGRRRR